ncbi:MAG: DUF2691 family protein [Candidatus Gastranaerophilaceae bacterium]|nr:DUF2691 family protein [Christensenellales bacterium]
MIGYKYNLIMKDCSMNSIVSSLLSNVNVEDYYWTILESEVYKKADTVECDGRYTGKEFKKALKDLDSCYIVRINIQASKRVIDAVEYYDEYINGECELVILIHDVIYNEVYCKLAKECDLIKKNCLKLDYDEFEVINDDSDCRTVFRV